MEKTKAVFKKILKWLLILILIAGFMSTISAKNYLGMIISALLVVLVFFSNEEITKKIKLPMNNKIKTISVIVGIIIISITTPNSPVKDTSNVNIETPKAQSVENVAVSEPQAVVAENVIVNEVAEQPVQQVSIIDKLWTALDGSIKTRSGYNIQYDESTKTVKISYVSKTAWDENALVRNSYTILVKYGSEAFKIDNVDAVTVNVITDFTDSYGKSSSEDAVIISMPKSEFSKYDWKALEYSPIYRQMKESCSEYYIHPAILKALNNEKLYLSTRM